MVTPDVKAWFRKWVIERPTLWATPDVGRVFMVCTGPAGCGRVVPVWRLVSAKPAPGDQGCRCGNAYVRVKQIPAWQAAWWLFVRSWLIRKVILKKTNWDARMPVRGGKLA